MPEQFKLFEVFIRTKEHVTYSHFWTAATFAEAEAKSLLILGKDEFIYKIEKDF